MTRTIDPPAVDEDDPFAAAPIVADRYVVIGKIGEGGMSYVYRAWDLQLERTVALKLLKRRSPGDRDAAATLPAPEVGRGRADLAASARSSSATRLIREARSMARLSHPNVLPVHDVAEHEGRIFIVMEFVAGTTLRAWLAVQTRPWPAAVAKFRAAAKGLAAAHAAGFVHRDFKPDNVLVGDDGRVRVMDFGLVREAAQPSTGSPIEVDARIPSSSDDLTAAGSVMGTLRYMAPEQHRGDPLGPAADQYAFCVALWEGLTGAPPFAVHGAKAMALAKADGPPRWPADVRVPGALAHAIRRGLSPSPDDRWPTMSALLTELDIDPGRRRRRISIAAALSITALFAWGFGAVQEARARAGCAVEGDRIAEVWNEGRAEEIGATFAATGIGYAPDTWRRAEARLKTYAQKWQAARTSMCEAAEVQGTLGAELLEAARDCFDEDRDLLDALLDQLSRADAMSVEKAAGASASLPLLASCTDEAALRRRPSSAPPDPGLREQIRALRSRLAEASAARAIGRYDEELSLSQSALEDAVAASWTPGVAEAHRAIGIAYANLGRFEEARDVQVEAFFEATSCGRDDLAMLASSALTYVVGYALANTKDGLHWGRLAQTLAARLGHEDDLTIANVLVNLGGVYFRAGDDDEATELGERALTIKENVLGGRHPDVAGALANLSALYLARGERAKASAAGERALAIFEQALGAEHPDTGMTVAQMANVYRQGGERKKALALFERALAIEERALGLEHPRLAYVLNDMGLLCLEEGELDDALATLQRALAIKEKAFGPAYPEVASTLVNLGGVHERRGGLAQALVVYERAVSILQAADGPDHPKLAMALVRVADVHERSGEHELAIDAYERALAIAERGDAEAPELAMVQFGLARSLLATGRDRGHAVELATQAREALWAAPDRAQALAEVDAWLRDADAETESAARR